MSANLFPLETIAQDEMQKVYAISPARHAEKAYQPNQGDKFPTLSTVPTTIGLGHVLVVLLSTIYNKPPFGRAEVQIIDYDALLRYNNGTFPTPEVAQKLIANYPQLVLVHCAGTTPCRGFVQLFANRVTVRVLTGGSKAKALDSGDYIQGGGKMA